MKTQLDIKKSDLVLLGPDWGCWSNKFLLVTAVDEYRTDKIIFVWGVIAESSIFGIHYWALNTARDLQIVIRE